MTDSIENDIESKTFTTEEVAEYLKEAESEDKITAFSLAHAVMEQFDPSFVIIGSPHLGVTDNGYSFPVELGLVINNDLNITKIDMAAILYNIAHSLSKDMDNLMGFIKKATGIEDGVDDDSIG